MTGSRLLASVLILTVVAPLAIIGCSSGDDQTGQPSDDPIKLGLVAPLSGSVAFDGQEQAKGARLAVKVINEEGGLLGRPVELIEADGECSPAVSVSAAEKLIVQDGVVAMGGAFCSHATKAVFPVLEEYQVAMVNNISSDPSLTDPGSDWFFRTKVHNGIRSKYFSKFIAEDLEAEVVAMLAVNDDFGRSGVSSHKDVLEDYGVSVPIVEYFEHGETNFQAVLTRIKNSGADTLFLVAEVQDGAMIMKQFYELGLDIPVASIGSLATPQFFELAGETAEGIYTAECYADGIDNPINQQFIEDFRAEYGCDPGNYNNAGYIEIWTIIEAIKLAQSTDPVAIRDALEQVDYQSSIGRVTFDDNHQARTHLYITKNQDGQAVLVAEIDTSGD